MMDTTKSPAMTYTSTNSNGKSEEPDHIAGRQHMLRSLQEELVGPSPNGPEIDLKEVVQGIFPPEFTPDGPYVQKNSKEEILCIEPPGLRYGIGILYPFGEMQELDGVEDGTADPVIETTLSTLASTENTTEQQILTNNIQGSIEELRNRKGYGQEVHGREEFDLSSANTRRPNSMAVSFLAELPTDGLMVVRASGGRYEPIEFTTSTGKQRPWWPRVPVKLEVRFEMSQLLNQAGQVLKSEFVEAQGLGSLDIRIEVYSRPSENINQRLITVCLINRTTEGRGNNQRCLFQASFNVAFELNGPRDCILPYPKVAHRLTNEEEQALDLLYREFETFAIGHGCSADWLKSDQSGTASKVSAVALPFYETPSITPDLRRADGSKIEVAMAPLAGLIQGENGRETLQEVIDLYEEWIEQKRVEADGLDKRHKDAANRHINLCCRCLNRIRDGLKFLNDDPDAELAFRLANEAILIQQLRSTRGVRAVKVEDGNLVFDRQAANIDYVRNVPGRGTWRPFQIAFLLMSLRSAAIGDDDDRETVDLIWFPTGGGKTEAYFGLAAFSAFYRRLIDTSNSGVQILMRYTLRLLTAQQFQRASGLICAMEYIRRREVSNLGEEPFSIGIWLGGDNTPNTRKDARSVLQQLNKGKQVANKLLLTKCPWCSAQIGPLKFKKTPPSGTIRVVGYQDNGLTVVLRCSDPQCEFVRGFPVYVIDEDIYEKRPTLVIGTVDKFAMLAWRPEARVLFGLDETGKRSASPPELIIQDELHLISGPLGSMTGLYEAVIEDFCIDYRHAKGIKPKIICSTATIRQFREQTKALFARTQTELFPPPGLSAADSFFSSYAEDDNGNLEPGRIFVGVYAPALGSIQTAEVRTFTTLLQAPLSMPPKYRDPWWTNLAFFNSLREIGTAATLFQSDIPDRLKILRRRLGLDYKEIRRLYELLELTSRLRSDAVPKAIEALEITSDEKPKPGKYPVDACLASNIIEVGVDIDRLSLLTIVGQPKTTSQYIQVAGRVGRRWFERPGLIVTILGPNNTRDRSHYEQFRSYHERLYAQVEPTSVTPYSTPVLERALHAVMVAYIRQYGDSIEPARPLPVPIEELNRLRDQLKERVTLIDPNETEAFTDKFNQRLHEWQTWNRTEWDTRSAGGDVGLLTVAGSYLPAEDWQFTWPTQMSMRNIDAECRAEITRAYLSQSSGDNDD